MKTTLEIDDELYREAKAVAALSGRKIKDLVTEGLRTVLKSSKGAGGSDQVLTSEERLRQCFSLADELMRSAPSGPSARALLQEDRDRYESK